jgi:hypothetical protein
MSTTKQRLAELDAERAQLATQLDQERAQKTIHCEACGKMHRIKDLVGIQTYWYVRPQQG